MGPEATRVGDVLADFGVGSSVGADRLETQRIVRLDRCFHGRQRVEVDARVSSLTSLLADTLDTTSALGPLFTR